MSTSVARNTFTESADALRPFPRSQTLTRIYLARRSAAKCRQVKQNRCCEYKPEVTLPGPPSAHQLISSYCLFGPFVPRQITRFRRAPATRRSTNTCIVDRGRSVSGGKHSRPADACRPFRRSATRRHLGAGNEGEVAARKAPSGIIDRKDDPQMEFPHWRSMGSAS